MTKHVRPADGGCWYCHRADDKLVVSGEFDTCVHIGCLRLRLVSACQEGVQDREAEIMAEELLPEYKLATSAAEAIAVLRMALAAIWTELEKDAPSLGDCQQIASEAINITVGWAGNGKVPSTATGLESWRDFRTKRGDKQHVKVE